MARLHGAQIAAGEIGPNCAAKEIDRVVVFPAPAMPSKHSLRLHLALTHEEVGEMIGTSRETVSRLFADFRKKQLIRSKGTILLILNKSALEGMAQG